MPSQRNICVMIIAVGLLVCGSPLAFAQTRRNASPSPRATPAPAPTKPAEVSRIPIYGTSSSNNSSNNSSINASQKPQTTSAGPSTAQWQALQQRNHVLNTLDGGSVALNRLLRDDRPTVIIFWSARCEICHTAIADWQAVYERYARQGLNVLALNVQDPALRGEVKSFMRDNGLSFPAYFASRDLHAQLTEGRMGTPMTFVFDREGQLAARLVGWTRGRGRQMLENVARGVLAE